MLCEHLDDELVSTMPVCEDSDPLDGTDDDEVDGFTVFTLVSESERSFLTAHGE